MDVAQKTLVAGAGAAVLMALSWPVVYVIRNASNTADQHVATALVTELAESIAPPRTSAVTIAALPTTHPSAQHPSWQEYDYITNPRYTWNEITKKWYLIQAGAPEPTTVWRVPAGYYKWRNAQGKWTFSDVENLPEPWRITDIIVMTKQPPP